MLSKASSEVKYLFIEIIPKNKRKILIGRVYRHHRDVHIDLFISIMENHSEEYNEIIILGISGRKFKTPELGTLYQNCRKAIGKSLEHEKNCTTGEDCRQILKAVLNGKKFVKFKLEKIY